MVIVTTGHRAAFSASERPQIAGDEALGDARHHHAVVSAAELVPASPRSMALEGQIVTTQRVAQHLLGEDGLPPGGDHDAPILVAWSDNGSEMTAIDTRQFMALMAMGAALLEGRGRGG